MKKFINKILLIGIIIIGIHVLLISHTFFLLKDKTFKIESKNIIIGDSNTRNAIDDKIFLDFKNLSQGGESYLFAYTKLNLITQHNKIDTLILSFAPHNIINNNWIDGTESGNLKYRTTAFFPYYSYEQHIRLLYGNPKSYISSWKSIYSTWLTNINRKSSESDISFMGGFLKNNKIENTENFTPFLNKPSEITPVEISYLNKIIEHCKQHKIKLIFLATPKNNLRKDFVYYDKIAFYNYYKDHYHNIDFLNFQNLKMPKKSYADISHLSYIGGEYFSIFLKENNMKKLLKDPTFNKRLSLESKPSTVQP